MKNISKFKLSLGWQILLGLIIGITYGIIFKNNKPLIQLANNLGTAFINLISMVVLPIVISSLTVGVASLGDIKKLSKIGIKTLIYFEILSTLAFILGILVANIANFGSMVDLNKLHNMNMPHYAGQISKHQGISNLLMSIIPTNIFKSMAKGELLPIIFFFTLFGLSLTAIGSKGKDLINIFDCVSNVMFKMTGLIMKLAPIGVSGLMAVTVAKLGIESLKPLLLFVLLAYATMLIYIFVVLGSVSKLFKFNLLDQLKVFKDELVLAFTTASSEVTIPSLIEKTQKLGVSSSISSFVIPVGYTFNLDGSALYQSLAAIFIAQAYHIHLSLSQQITLVIILMVTSKGMAGVPGASFLVLMSSLSTIGIPSSGVMLIAGIDRIIDMGRTVVNVVGNVIATLIIGKSENEFDIKKHNELLKVYKNEKDESILD